MISMQVFSGGERQEEAIEPAGLRMVRQKSRRLQAQFEECGEVCSPEEYVEEIHRWTLGKWLKDIPLRTLHFFTRKFERLMLRTQPAKVVLGAKIRAADTVANPFLELKVTFTPDKDLAVLYYFQALSTQKRLGVKVEFDRITELLNLGANINAKDEAGKTVMHAACREEGLEVIRFLVEHGAAMNTMDKHGRTPLHMAAAMDNHSIIGYLVEEKADYGAITHNDVQTPLHYAAKNDAPGACKVLVEYGSNIESKDYRGRTPLLLAAELDRSVAASTLLDLGASAKVLDYTGYHPVCAMIRNMPDVAVKGLNQFYKFNKTTRQEFYYLNCLEPSLIGEEGTTFPSPSVLEEIVITQNQELVNHPVIKEMIKVKWSQFGIFGCIYELIFYMVTLVIWSSLLLVKTYIDRGNVVASDIIATISIFLFLMQLGEEVMELVEGYRDHGEWKSWKLKQIQSDIRFVVLPENIDEKNYLEDMERSVKVAKSSYWSDFWNVYDWLFIIFQSSAFLSFTIVRGMELGELPLGNFRLYRSMLLCTALILAWIKLFKYLKVFEVMGPFVMIIANSFNDIFKITFIFFILYVPAVCVFWQFFGSSDIEEYMDLMSLSFTVFRMMLVDDYAYTDLLEYCETASIPESWLDFIVAYWLLASAIILLNLFIALMSDTFQRIYEKSIEVAALQKAETIVGLERKLSSKRRDMFLAYIKKNFSPRIVYIEGETVDDHEGLADHHQHHSSVKGLTKQIISSVRELAGGGLAAPGDSASSEHGSVATTAAGTQKAGDLHAELRAELEEQEIMLRKTIRKLEMTAT